MDTDGRLAVIDALERKSTGTLRNYFAAQGYGPAFDRLDKSSKASRIAEALREASQDGHDEEILDHARHHFGISVPTAPQPTGTELIRRLNDNQLVQPASPWLTGSTTIPTPASTTRLGTTSPTSEPENMTGPDLTTAFVVHGHDPRNYREIVARLIERSTDLRPVILDEQPNLGQHLLGKLKTHGTEKCVAIVIMTGDDRGRVATRPPDDDQPRARQNVILELGYFIGKLPPERIIVLYEEDVEMPSDIKGVAYYSLGRHDWRDKLAKELHAIGVNVRFPSDRGTADTDR